MFNFDNGMFFTSIGIILIISGVLLLSLFGMCVRDVKTYPKLDVTTSLEVYRKATSNLELITENLNSNYKAIPIETFSKIATEVTYLYNALKLALENYDVQELQQLYTRTEKIWLWSCLKANVFENKTIQQNGLSHEPNSL